jgi:hypothetical protein
LYKPLADGAGHTFLAGHPNHRLGVLKCGNLNIAAPLCGMVCDIRVI